MKTINDIIKKFEEESKDAVSENRQFWEGQDEDDMYTVDIHVWRKPGMGNSLQTIAGNKISIMTATASYLQTLMDKKIVSVKELEGLVAISIKGHRGKMK